MLYNKSEIFCGSTCFNWFKMPILLAILLAILETWLEQFRFSFKVNPKKLKSLTCFIGVLLIFEFGIKTLFCALWNIMKFDLVMFIESIFKHNHIYIFSNSAFKIGTSLLFFISYLLMKAVSSANKIKWKISLELTISFIYIKNKSGPRKDPWGTPVVMGSM